MSNLGILARFYPDDKDIYDMLMSAEQKATPARLRDFAAARGLHFSADEDRRTIIGELSILPMGWLELSELVNMVASEQRRRARTSASVDVTATLNEVTAAVAGVVATLRERHPDDVVDHHVGGGVVTVEVTHTQMQYGRARMFQPEKVHTSIEFEPGAAAVVIRRESDPRAVEAVDLCIKALESALAVEIDASPKSLAGVTDPARRIGFFNTVMHGMSGFDFVEVEDVKLGRMSVLPPAVDPSDGEPDDDVELLEREAVEEVKGVVREVAFKGDKIELSPEYRELLAKCRSNGFFLARTTWVVREAGGERFQHTLELAFSDVATATGLEFAVKWTRKCDVNGNYNQTLSRPTPVADRALTRALEASIDVAYDALSAPDVVDGTSEPPDGQ